MCSVIGMKPFLNFYVNLLHYVTFCSNICLAWAEECNTFAAGKHFFRSGRKQTMKKLITLILTVCMLACMGVVACADGDTVTVTVASGDTMWGLCNKQNINYYSCREAIMALNGFKSEDQLGILSVGQKVVLPVSEAAAKTVDTGKKSESKSEEKPAEQKAEIVSGTVVSYIISYKMNSGDTVSRVYDGWGLDYKAADKMILTLNSLKSYNYMYSGRTYLFPVTSLPSGETAAYSVMAYKVQSGDTAYDICSSYKISYNASLPLIKALNNGSDLTTIYADRVIYLPVAGAVESKPADAGKGESAVPRTETVTYPVNCMECENGKVVAKVNGTPVTSVAAGTKVTLCPTADEGHKVVSVSVAKTSDPTTTLTVTANTFVMPSYAVNITVIFE